LFKGELYSIVNMNVLLDFDGVLLQNDRINKIIKERSIQYVKHRTKLPYDNAKILNNQLYPALGHTALILNNNHNYHHEVFEYNKQVFYDMNFQEYIQPCFNDEDKNHIQNMLDIIECFGKKPGLFTNTPLIWVEQNLDCLGLQIEDIFDTNMLFTSDEGFIKPKFDTYERINNYLYKQNTLFIDDSVININAITQYDNWVGFHIPYGKKQLLYTYLKLIHSIAK